MAFVDRYARAFGRANALMLRVSGLTGSEVRAEGPWIFDENGDRWVDFGSFGVHLLGHRHPEVVAAAREQLDRMGLSGKVLGNEAATRCAEALLRNAPDGLDRVVFANGGAEAVEVAIKMACLATGRGEFVALERSYHGKTIGAASLSNALALPDAIRMRAPVHLVSTDEVDRLESLLRSGRMAALFVEPVQGEGGIRPVAPAWIATAAQICRETGTLLALDEIQTGLGRCGRIWRSGGDVAPDLLTVGKTLGGGLVPIAAVLYASERVGARASDPVVHASSFAGGALAGAVGRRVVELVEAPGFLKRVREDGEFVRFHLERRLASLEHVEAVRGEGLMMGVEFRDPSVCGHVVLEAAKRKLLVTFCLHDPRVMRVYPPVGCAPEVLEGAIATLVDSVESVPVDGA